MVAVTRHRKPGIDVRTGDRATGPAAETVLQAVAVWPSESVDEGDADARGRNGTREELVVAFADADVDLDPRTDTVVVDGVEYEVAGLPKRYANPHAPGAQGATVTIWRAVG